MPHREAATSGPCIPVSPPHDVVVMEGGYISLRPLLSIFFYSSVYTDMFTICSFNSPDLDGYQHHRFTPHSIATLITCLSISGPGLQIEAGKTQTMPESGGNKYTEAEAGGGGSSSGQRKRRAEEDTGASSGSGAVQTAQVEQGQRKRRAGGGGGQELPGGYFLVMACA
jgi:hypothetical protein